MEYLLIASVALFIGFGLGVLVMTHLAASDPDELTGPPLLRAHTVSAWWR
jgi:hypothetical protein